MPRTLFFKNFQGAEAGQPSKKMALKAEACQNVLGQTPQHASALKLHFVCDGVGVAGPGLVEMQRTLFFKNFQGVEAGQPSKKMALKAEAC